MTFTVIFLTLVAQNDPDAFADANAAAENGDYATAVDRYEELLLASPQASGVWYNLGHAAYRAEQLGRSIAAFRTAAALAPRDPRIKNNLTLARKGVSPPVSPSVSNPILATLFFWHYSLSVGELGWLAIGCGGLFWTAAIVLRNRVGQIAGILGVLSLVLFFGSWTIRVLSPASIAVVNRDNAPVRTRTDRRSDVRFTVPEGAELRWREEVGTWIRVSHPDGQQGWIHRDDVFLLSL
ncbi:MAG: SH3 domain-containing protein [Myxococcota bacterium]